MNIDLATIFQILPHRPPFLFLDLVREVEPLKSGVGVKLVTADEEMNQGFCRDKMALPGILTLEMMAQTAAVICAAGFIEGPGLVAPEHQAPGAGFLVSADVTFGREILPGDTLVARISIIKAWGRFVMAEGEVSAGRDAVARGRLTIAAA